MSDNAKAASCLKSGELDGWEVALGYSGEVTPNGSTRIVVTAPESRLSEVHRALVGVLGEPLSFLYRQKIDRREPKPEGHPGRDFVALELARSRVLEALEAHEVLLYRDARCEAWVRGRMNDQVVLDVDGAIYCYPDDPAFRDVLEKLGVTEAPELVTLEDRDYVRHWFRKDADAQEDSLMGALNLAEVPVRQG
ncbi:MAG: hypothetical protein R3F61_18650 [Myxococcota bacterium]